MPEVFSDNFRTTTTDAIASAARPVTFHVADISPQLAGGSFSALVFDAGTEADPQHAERLHVTATAGMEWTADTEGLDIPQTHAAGSIVIQILTARSLQQPLADHIADTDPHPGLVRKAAYVAKGDLLTGTGPGALTRVPSGPDGSVPIADSSKPGGWRMGAMVVGALSSLGDILVQSYQGVARLAAGTLGQYLTMVANTEAIADPAVAPATADATAPPANTWAPSTTYQIGYTWQIDLGDQGTGETLVSPLVAYAAPGVPVAQTVSIPAAPALATGLAVYVGLDAGSLQLATVVANPSGGAVNPVVITGPGAGAAPPGTNSTGGLSPAWGGLVFGVAPSDSVPGDVAVEGGSTSPARADHVHGREATPDPKFSAAAMQALADAGTIVVPAGATTVRVTPAAAVTGIILQASTVDGWELSVINEAVAADTITFAAAGSNVAGDDSAPVIPGLTFRKFVWNADTGLWYPQA